MAKIRVLIVDDSVVIRRLLGDCLSGDPDIEIAGTAASGRIGLAKIVQVAPDVVTLDVEMPEMDGIATLIEIRKTHPRLPVIMFSTLTERGAASTLDALSHGASDYVTKPANVGSVASALQRIRDQMIPKIKALCASRRPEPPPATLPRRAVPSLLATPARALGAPGIVAIGVSTGGPNALAKLLPELPADFPLPIVVVQHMPPMFTKLLAERLATRCPLPVREAQGGETLRAGEVWIAPGDHHMTLLPEPGGARLALNQEPPENSCRPAVDVLFRSVAMLYRERTLAVILTGMGQDGLIGCQWVKEHGGRVLVQDEASSVVWGMPGFVARAGLADRVLPLERISAEIVRVTAPPQAGAHAAGAER